MSIEAAIVFAVKNRVSLEVEYQGNLCQVSPCRFGWRTQEQTGERCKCVLVYQFGGYSIPALKPDISIENLRCWDLKDIALALPIQDPWRCPKAGSTTCIEDAIVEAQP